MRLSVRLFSIVTVLAATTLAARADTFSYGFSYAPFNDAFTYTYTSPVLITTDTTFTPTTCTIRGSACTSVDFQPSIGYIQITPLRHLRLLRRAPVFVLHRGDEYE